MYVHDEREWLLHIAFDTGVERFTYVYASLFLHVASPDEPGPEQCFRPRGGQALD
jgi:hypothetical protein